MPNTEHLNGEMMATSEEASHLRFGVMCNGTSFPAWQAACLRSLMRINGVSLELLIIREPVAPQRRQSRAIKAIKLLFSRNLGWWLLQLVCNHRSRSLQTVDMATELANVPRISCTTKKRGKWSEYFHEQDVSSIRTHDLDFVLRFAFGIIRGNILTTPRYGVWSFHHGDEEKYRGSPPGFWEIYKGDQITGTVLQRLTDRLDAGIILKKGQMKTDLTSYTKNRDNIFMESASWPAQVCKELQKGVRDYLLAPPSITNATIFHDPNNLHVAHFCLRTCSSLFRKAMRELCFVEQWNVGIVRAPIETFLNATTSPPVEWFAKLPSHCYVADPFTFDQDGNPTVYCEQYDYRLARGRISAATADHSGTKWLGNVLEREHHLSYPFLFIHEGRRFCVPECSEAGDVVLYEVSPSTGSWEEVATLIRGFAAIDSTLFQHHGMWWLFATHADDGPSYKLRIWFARDLLGPWTRHSLDPAKIDIRSSRPAGTPFLMNGDLHYPTQDYSQRSQGRISICRITKLTTTAFQDEIVATVSPYVDSPYPAALHTLSAAGGCTLIDGCRDVCVLTNRHLLRFALRQLRERLRATVKKGGNR